jgi:hypothetical protein
VGEEEVVGVSSSLLSTVKLATPESCCSGPVGPSNLLALDLSRDKTRDAETITGISIGKAWEFVFFCDVTRVSKSRRMDWWMDGWAGVQFTWRKWDMCRIFILVTSEDGASWKDKAQTGGYYCNGL